MTEQLLGLLAPASVQVALLNVPTPEWAKVTVPPGADEPLPDVSLTVAVQVVACPAGNGALQLTEVLVLRLFTVTAKVPLLVLWVVLPP